MSALPYADIKKLPTMRAITIVNHWQLPSRSVDFKGVKWAASVEQQEESRRRIHRKGKMDEKICHFLAEAKVSPKLLGLYGFQVLRGAPGFARFAAEAKEAAEKGAPEFIQFVGEVTQTAPDFDENLRAQGFEVHHLLKNFDEAKRGDDNDKCSQIVNSVKYWITQSEETGLYAGLG